MKSFTIRTSRTTELIPITDRLQQLVSAAGITDGALICFVPHTTAGITINENADPAVVSDLLYVLDRAVPQHDPEYRHGEGNTAAHVKASLMGSSVTLLIRDGQLQLGRWQAVFLAEFDGPRTRQVWVHFSR